MGVHSTITVSREAAIDKLKSVDWEDVPIDHLEDVLDRLLKDTPYNFTVLDGSLVEDDWNDGVLAGLEVPSNGTKEFWSLSGDDRDTYRRLEEEGYGSKEILLLLESRKA